MAIDIHNLRRHSNEFLFQDVLQLTARKSFFGMTVINCWNALSHVVDKPSTNAFKNRVTLYGYGRNRFGNNIYVKISKFTLSWKVWDKFRLHSYICRPWKPPVRCTYLLQTSSCQFRVQITTIGYHGNRGTGVGCGVSLNDSSIKCKNREHISPIANVLLKFSKLWRHYVIMANEQGGTRRLLIWFKMFSGIFTRDSISAYMPRQFHSARPSVTRVLCVKTAERIIEILSRSDRPITLVFRHQGSLLNSDGFTRNGGAKYKGGSNFRPIYGYISETVIDRGIVEDEYKVVYVLYRIVPLSMTLSDLKSQFQGHSIV